MIIGSLMSNQVEGKENDFPSLIIRKLVTGCSGWDDKKENEMKIRI
jgi:hypothetical protein